MPTSRLATAAPTQHPRLARLLEELTPELAAAGYTADRHHPAWARNHPRGLITMVLSYAPDDNEGGWVEPFIGIIDQEVQTLVNAFVTRPANNHLRSTLLVGASRWMLPSLDRQPVHSESEVLEAANEVLRWWREAGPNFETAFGQHRQQLDDLYNSDHPQARRYLTNENMRALTGVAVRHVLDPTDDLLGVLKFHRERMLESGFWEVYGEQVRGFVTTLS